MTPRTRWMLGVLMLVLAWAFSPAHAAGVAPPGAEIRAVDDAWRAALPLDAEAATQAYLDRLSPQAVARSNAYFEGGYWLQLWNWLAGLAVGLLLLATHASAALRDWTVRTFRWRPLGDAAYGAVYLFASTLLVLPLTAYQSYFREHAYGMATQSLAGWLGEQAIALGLTVVIGAVVIALLYAALRRAGRQWWPWATAVTMVFMVIGIALSPVYIEPLFNTYKPVPEGPVRTTVLQMAKANGVPADEVYVFDASRQTNRVSANVTGLFGTAAVRLNDNLLDRSSMAEIRTVMGHEIGHYALNHVTSSVITLGLAMAAVFIACQWAMRRLIERWGARWRLDVVRGVADTASLPLLSVVFSTCILVLTPVFNTITRAQETEADLWGLNLAREPHGEAEVLLKLTEYRKPDPGPLEEFIFYTHPSTRTRIYHAMRWREQMAGRP